MVKKKSRKYKACYKYLLVCMEEKLALAYNNNLNQRSEILNLSEHRKTCLLSK